MTVRIISLLAVAAVVGMFAGCSGGSNAPPPASNVVNTAVVDLIACPGGEAVVDAVGASNFSPVSAAVAAMGVVKWTNPSTFAHTVTSGAFPSPDGTFDLSLPSGGTVCLRFKVVGSFPYYCKLHPVMTGAVNVQ